MVYLVVFVVGVLAGALGLYTYQSYKAPKENLPEGPTRETKKSA